MHTLFRSLIVAAFLTFTGHSAHADTAPDPVAFQLAVKSYSEAKARDAKSEVYLYAQRAWKLGMPLYAGDEKTQALLTYRYGEAAAGMAFREALGILEDSRTLYLKAEGEKSRDALYPTLAAADEALRRHDDDEAYSYYLDVIDRAKAAWPNGSPYEAAARVGIGRLHLQAGEHKKAQGFFEAALALYAQAPDDAHATDRAEAYYWAGQNGRDDPRPVAAKAAYEQALALYLAHAPKARRVLTLHKRLVEMGAKLGDEALATRHCQQAARFRALGQGLPAYDPTGILFNSRNDGPRIAMLVRYAIGPNGRAHDVKIIKTKGISPARAKEIIAGTYYVPVMRDGKIVDSGIQRITYEANLPM